MLKRCLKLTLLLAILGLLPGAAQAQERRFKATLISYEEVPALSNTATGTFNMLIDFSDTSFSFQLSFAGVSGTGATQSHIHIGQKGVNGGIMVFFCTNLGNSNSLGAPSCPENGTVGGTITAANVGTAAAAQGIAAGEFAEVLKAIRAGTVYVNVHSSLFPGGEIRGQLVPDVKFP